MSLASGKNITLYSWDAIPMTDTVICGVNQLGMGQPKRFIFTDQKGRPIRMSSSQEWMGNNPRRKLMRMMTSRFQTQSMKNWQRNHQSRMNPQHWSTIRTSDSQWSTMLNLHRCNQHIHQRLLQIQLLLPIRLKFQYLSQSQEYEGPHGLRYKLSNLTPRL